jgi:hypothetical protein
VTKQNPRPRKYASDAEKQAAYRARAAEVCVRLEPKTMQTLDSIADEIGYSRNELMQSMVKFGLTNRDWRNEGLTAHKRLPRYQENPGMATKPPSPAQLAARARFAEMARNGSLNRKRQIAAKKRVTNPAPKHKNIQEGIDYAIKRFANSMQHWMDEGYSFDEAFERVSASSSLGPASIKKAIAMLGVKRNPRKKTVSEKISQLVHEGYPQKQAVAVALNEQRAGKVKRNPSRAKPKSSTVYRVEYSKDCKKWDVWMTVMYLDMAKAIAQRLADDPFHKNHYVRIESATEIL